MTGRASAHPGPTDQRRHVWRPGRTREAPPRASITFDRGREFCAHARLREIHVDTYFCNPHSPWQKGAVENLNGRLRRIIPKGRLTHLDQTILDRIAHRFNNTPRKCLGFKTPREAFSLQLTEARCVRN